MSDKEKLRNMLDSLINNKSEQAEVNFHDYLQSKMQEVLKKDSDQPASDESDSK